MLFTATAKDTFMLFAGNLGAAFWGFLFTLFVARSMSVYEFGILSAVFNFVCLVPVIIHLLLFSVETIHP